MEKVGLEGTINNVSQLMFNTKVTYENSNVNNLGRNFVTIGCNNKNVFQGLKVEVTFI